MIADKAEFTSTFQGSFATNRHALLTHVSKQLAGFCGYIPAELHGKPFSILFADHLQETLNKNHDKLFDTNSEETKEYHLRHKDGRQIPVSVHSVVLSNEDGNGIRFSTVILVKKDMGNIDFYLYMQKTGNSFFLTKTDGSIIETNNAACKLFGYSEDELKAMGRDGIIKPEDNPLLKDVLQNRKANGSITAEMTGRKKNGERFPIEVSSSFYSEKDGEEYTGTVITDLSGRKQVEQELELLVNNTEESFVLVDTKLNIVRFNKQFFTLYKTYYNKEVQRGENILHYSPSIDKDKLQELYKKVLAGQTIETEIEIANSSKTPVTFYLKYKPLKTENEQIAGVFISGIDITEKRKLEQMQVASEKRYRALVENGADGVVILSERGRPVYLSSSVEKMLGYTKEEYAKLDVFSLVHPYDIDKLSEVWDIVLKTPGKPIHAPATRVQHKDGSWRWVQDIITNMLHEPAINGIIDNFSDVTDIVNAHEELFQKQFQIELAETNYREIFEKANDGIFIYNIETGLLAEVNTKACELLGCSKEELLMSSRKKFEADIPGFGVRVAMEKFTKAVNGKPQLFEWVIKKPNGSIGWMEVSLKRASIAGSDRVLAFFRAIDNRKKIEEELKKLSRIARETNNSVVITDTRGRIQWVNEAFTKITEYELNEIIGKNPKDFLQGPDTSPVARRYMRIKITNGRAYKCDLINYSKSGKKYWIRIECQPRLDEQGNLIGFFAIQTDITKEKEAENFVKLSEEKYRSLFEFNPSCIIIWDPANLKILEVNNKTTEVYGFSKEEFLKMNIMDFRPASDVERIKNLADAFLNNSSENYKGLWQHYNKSGELMPMSFASHVIIYNGEKAILGMGDNIKEKLKLEKELEEERTQKQFEITEAVLSTQEKERKEIGEELHDNVNQILAGAILYLGLSRKEIDKKIPFLDETEKLLNSAIYELRNISHALIPPRLPELSLEDSLENIIKLTEHTGIIIHKEFLHIEENAVSPELKLAIYRIVQEHFTNILKHAKAANIYLAVINDDNVVKLSIKDDGIGFDTSRKNKGVGLMNIKARASLFDSKVVIHSAKGKGCELQIKFKISSDNADNT